MIRFACVAAIALSLALTALPAAAQGTGLVFLEPDRYRSIPLAPPTGLTSIPAEMDLSKDFPTPGDQGNQGSCVGWAVGYALKSYQERRERLWTNWDDTRRMSPAFVYNQVKVGDCNDGARIADALDLVTSTGAAAWADQLYSENSCNDLPTAIVKQNASVNRVAAWFRVNPQDRQAIKTSIAAGIPVVVGMTVDDRFKALQSGETWRGGGIPGEAHAMVVVGYSDTRDAVKVINSWGTDWGDGGFGWIAFETFRAVTREAYVAQDIVLPVGMVERRQLPYAENNGPFGPKLQGLQLGMSLRAGIEKISRSYDQHSEITNSIEYDVLTIKNEDGSLGPIEEFVFSFDRRFDYLSTISIVIDLSSVTQVKRRMFSTEIANALVSRQNSCNAVGLLSAHTNALEVLDDAPEEAKEVSMLSLQRVLEATPLSELTDIELSRSCSIHEQGNDNHITELFTGSRVFEREGFAVLIGISGERSSNTSWHYLGACIYPQRSTTCDKGKLGAFWPDKFRMLLRIEARRGEHSLLD